MVSPFTLAIQPAPTVFETLGVEQKEVAFPVTNATVVTHDTQLVVQTQH
jgi:hypothetical protein